MAARSSIDRAPHRRCAARAGRARAWSRLTASAALVGHLGRPRPARSPTNSSFTAGRVKNRFGPSRTRSSTSSTSASRWSASGGMAVSILIAMPDPTALRRIVDARLPRYPRRARDARQHRLRLVHARRASTGSPTSWPMRSRELGAEVERMRPSAGRGPTAARRPRHRPARRRRPAAAAHRPHGHRLRPGNGRRAAVSVQRRPGDRPRRDRHEGRAAGGTARHRRPARGRRATRRHVRRQPGRGDRLAVQHADHPLARAAARRRAGPRVRARQRRHRQRAQGHRRLPPRAASGARPTRASSRRRAAPPSWRRRTRCWRSTRSTAAGRR